MTRITPRTCLWPLAISLSFTFALSIGLTYRSNTHCYAGTCGEWLFPLQARLHVVIWYSWLSISITLLAIRAFNPILKKRLAQPLSPTLKLPFLGPLNISLSTFLISIWIILLYSTIIAIWWTRLSTYFLTRGLSGGIPDGNQRLAAIALTGHLCDVTMGMAMLPISRHSALASFFKVGVASTLSFHRGTAYTLFTLVLIHGLLYISWLPVFYALSGSLRLVYPVLNPTYLTSEVWPGNMSSLGYWRASLVFTGLFASLIFVAIFATTFPWVRNKYFNVFYFTHLLGIVALVGICLHASTMFYCTAPGLAMWVLDWAMRVWELWSPLQGRIESLGRGWYQITTPLPRERLRGCAYTSPLAHFYIHHADSSIRELHPFTTMTHLASQNAITDPSLDDLSIQFLFRARGPKAVPNILGGEGGNGEKMGEKRKRPVITRAQSEIESKRGFAPLIGAFLHRLQRRRSNSQFPTNSLPKLQWTAKLAQLSDTSTALNLNSKGEGDRGNEMQRQGESGTGNERGVPVSLRLEGPYFTPADPSQFHTVVCLVAGTGVSGALAIAGAFREGERRRAIGVGVRGNGMCGEECGHACGNGNHGRGDCGQAGGDCATAAGRRNGKGKGERRWKRCIVIWSIREGEEINLKELEAIPSSNLEIRIHLTGPGHSRLNALETLSQILDEEDAQTAQQSLGAPTTPELAPTSTAKKSRDTKEDVSETGVGGVGDGRIETGEKRIGEMIRGERNENGNLGQEKDIEVKLRRKGKGKMDGKGSGKGRMWIYISGPNAFISAGEEACKSVQDRGVEWYGAKWEI